MNRPALIFLSICGFLLVANSLFPPRVQDNGSHFDVGREFLLSRGFYIKQYTQERVAVVINWDAYILQSMAIAGTAFLGCALLQCMLAKRCQEIQSDQEVEAPNRR